jgi:hypothetical protein
MNQEIMRGQMVNINKDKNGGLLLLSPPRSVTTSRVRAMCSLLHMCMICGPTYIFYSTVITIFYYLITFEQITEEYRSVISCTKITINAHALTPLTHITFVCIDVTNNFGNVVTETHNYHSIPLPSCPAMSWHTMPNVFIY